MTIANTIRQIKSLLEKIEAYDKIVTSNNFESSTVDDMKDNAKDTCDQIKCEIDEIKTEIDLWG